MATRWRWPPDSSAGRRSQIGLQRQHRRGRGDAFGDQIGRRAGLFQAEPHIVAHREMRIERVGLEHHGDAALGRRQIVDVVAVDDDIAGRGVLQPRDDAQQRRFPAARRPHEHDEFAIPDVEVDALQHLDPAEGFLDVFDFQRAHGDAPVRSLQVAELDSVAIVRAPLCLPDISPTRGRSAVIMVSPIVDVAERRHEAAGRSPPLRGRCPAGQRGAT